ncbi:hypothetical protein RHECNPAF_470023 [Rhizobium etli CNPAF512]|nr:hypothetical protein RHECNPAF_470023 [Rhizobium etli CNPAF512]
MSANRIRQRPAPFQRRRAPSSAAHSRSDGLCGAAAMARLE